MLRSLEYWSRGAQRERRDTPCDELWLVIGVSPGISQQDDAYLINRFPYSYLTKFVRFLFIHCIFIHLITVSQGLICSGIRCADPNDLGCAEAGQRAMECNIAQPNRPPVCCDGLECDANKFCNPAGAATVAADDAPEEEATREEAVEEEEER